MIQTEDLGVNYECGSKRFGNAESETRNTRSPEKLKLKILIFGSGPEVPEFRN